MGSLNKYYLEVWIGLVNVKANSKKNDILGKSENAYTIVLGMANSKENYKRIVRKAFSKLNLQVIRIEDVEPFNLRIQKNKVDKDLIKLAKELTKNSELIRLSTFYTYPAQIKR